MKMSLRSAIVLAALAAATPTAMATPNVPPPPQTQALMITGATLHTVTGETIVNGRMLVDRGRIVAIGSAAAVPDQAGAKVVSLAGKHVYPGLIAANTTLGLVEVQSVRATVDTSESGAINPNARALVAVNADSELLPVTRANGVLAALAAPRASAATLIAGTSAVIQLDGWTWEDMGVKADVGLHVILPSMRTNAALFPNLPAARIEDIQRVTAQRLKTLEDALDSAAAYLAAKAADPSLPVDTRWESMRAALKAGPTQQPMFIHAEELPQMRYALNLAERYKLNIVIVGGQDAHYIAPLLRERKVPVIIGGVHRLPLRRGDDPDTPFRLAAQLHEAGVTFAIARGGSAFDAAMERSLSFEAGSAVGYGLPAAEALKAITIYPATILGVADKLGSLERGKLANFFVTDGDPLDIRTNVERIYIQGREIPLEDKQTALNRKYEQKYQQLNDAKNAATKK
jgi:imidazolonepropionase-like amidohydrolase